MKFININGTDYRADMISRITGIYPVENTHNFKITCDGKDYGFCEYRLAVVQEMRDSLVEALRESL